MRELIKAEHKNIAGKIVCPLCGYRQDDRTFLADNYMEGRVLCDSCGGEFTFESGLEVFWSTTPA